MSAPLRATVSPGLLGMSAGVASCARVWRPLGARPSRTTMASVRETVNRRIAHLPWFLNGCRHGSREGASYRLRGRVASGPGLRLGAAVCVRVGVTVIVGCLRFPRTKQLVRGPRVSGRVKPYDGHELVPVPVVKLGLRVGHDRVEGGQILASEDNQLVPAFWIALHPVRL